MYAVIASGGKQQKVSQGQVVQVELIKGDIGSTVEFTPVLAVDGDSVISDKTGLGKVKIEGKVLGIAKGKKINGFTYKNKSNQRKRWGHRQKYTEVEITSIKAGKA
jgi:large subunit ribosomal protein L21